MNRRDWLKTAGGLVVGFTFSGLPAFGEQVAPASPLSSDGRPLDPREVDSFLAINADGRSRSTRARWTSAPACASRSRRWPPRSSASTRARVTVVDGDTGALSEHRRHRRQHRAHARRHRRSSGRGDRATGAARPRRHAVEASRRGPDDRRRRGAARGRRPWGRRSARSIGGRRLAVPVDAKAPLVSPPRYTVVGTVAAAARRAREVHGAVPLHPGLHRSGHAPRARDPAAGDRRDARVGRRSAPSPIFRASASSDSRAFWPSSRATSGPRSAPRAS